MSLPILPFFSSSLSNPSPLAENKPNSRTRTKADPKPRWPRSTRPTKSYPTPNSGNALTEAKIRWTPWPDREDTHSRKDSIHLRSSSSSRVGLDRGMGDGGSSSILAMDISCRWLLALLYFLRGGGDRNICDILVQYIGMTWHYLPLCGYGVVRYIRAWTRERTPTCVKFKETLFGEDLGKVRFIFGCAANGVGSDCHDTCCALLY